MTHRTDAEEHLRIIRSLMEKATIYRAISAPGALVGGLLAVALASFGVWGDRSEPAFPFVAGWLSILLFTSIVNTWLLWQDASRRHEPFVSPGMKVALRAMLPGFIAGGVATLIEGRGGVALTVSLWVLCYGLSLLSASHFAPCSIQWLGRAFFVTGAGLLVVGSLAWHPLADPTGFRIACMIMGVTFGAFHLIYGVCIILCGRSLTNRTP